MDIPSQGTERVCVRHGPCRGRMGTCAFGKPVQLFEHKEKCQGVWVTPAGGLPLGDPVCQCWLWLGA